MSYNSIILIVWKSLRLDFCWPSATRLREVPRALPHAPDMCECTEPNESAELETVKEGIHFLYVHRKESRILIRLTCKIIF